MPRPCRRRRRSRRLPPAKDLANQADQYLKSLGKSVATEEDYKDDQGKIAKESNTLVIIALALGLHDQESKYKAQAGALIKAAQAVAATKDYPSAKKAIAALQEAAADGAKADAELKWKKVASLPELMKQVPLINNKLKRYIKPNNFKKKAKEHGRLHGRDRRHRSGLDGQFVRDQEARRGEKVVRLCGGDAR